MIKNYGPFCGKTPNNTLIEINGTDFYFSYKTIIAVRHHGKLYIRENSWGPTTAKHLNAVNREHDRLPSEQFEKVLSQLNINISGEINGKV